MAMMQVNSTTLRNHANELRALNEQLKGQVGNLQNDEATLSKNFKGDAQTAFHNAFTSDIEQFTTFYALIEQYIQALEDIAQKFDEAEARNVEIATTRTY